MKKIKLLLSAAAVALVAMFTLAPAVQAQTVASLTADPVFVEAAGANASIATSATAKAETSNLIFFMKNFPLIMYGNTFLPHESL